MLSEAFRDELIRNTGDVLQTYVTAQNFFNSVHSGLWARVVPIDCSLLNAVTAVINAADAEGWLRDLVQALAEKFPQRPEFKAALLKIDPAGFSTDGRPSLFAKVSPNTKIAPFQRRSLLQNSLSVQSRTHFPSEILSVSPDMLDTGLRWGRQEDAERSFFFVGLDGTVEYRALVNEGATFMEGDQPTKPGAPRAGVSALQCLSVVHGILRFWTHWLSGQPKKTGTVTVAIKNTFNKYLSFNGLDGHLNEQYPSSWVYTFWNHDGSKAVVDLIKSSLEISSQMVDEDILIVSTEMLAMS